MSVRQGDDGGGDGNGAGSTNNAASRRAFFVQAAVFTGTGVLSTIVAQQLMYAGAGDAWTMLLPLSNYAGMAAAALVPRSWLGLGDDDAAVARGAAGHARRGSSAGRRGSRGRRHKRLSDAGHDEEAHIGAASGGGTGAWMSEADAASRESTATLACAGCVQGGQGGNHSHSRRVSSHASLLARLDGATAVSATHAHTHSHAYPAGEGEPSHRADHSLLGVAVSLPPAASAHGLPRARRGGASMSAGLAAAGEGTLAVPAEGAVVPPSGSGGGSPARASASPMWASPPDSPKTAAKATRAASVSSTSSAGTGYMLATASARSLGGAGPSINGADGADGGGWGRIVASLLCLPSSLGLSLTLNVYVASVILLDCLGYVLHMYAIKLAGSSIYQVLYASVVVWAALGSRFVRGTRLNGAQWGGIALVLGGLA
jgi:hypothetical protein